MEEIYCFGGNPLDRAGLRRGEREWVAGLLAAPESRVALFTRLKPRIRFAPCPGVDWQPMAPWRGLIDAGATLILLGLDAAGHARFALDAGGAELPDAPDVEATDLRGVASTLPAGEAAMLGEGKALIDWHDRHRFCAQCGTPTDMAQAGWTRRCPNPDCKATHFPRTDPVVIMLAVDGERCLLGRNRRRPGARFSCLAGFMEPGETLEEAVRREILEESGIRTGTVRYVASQPWPFPSSLMMGFLAQAETTEIAIDPDELAEARWFSRDEARAMVARATTGPDDPSIVSIPPPLAIGHQIIRRRSEGMSV